MHPPPQPLAQRPLVERRHPQRPTSRADRARQARARRPCRSCRPASHIAHLARVRDLHILSGRHQLIIAPRARRSSSPRTPTSVPSVRTSRASPSASACTTPSSAIAALAQRTPRRPSIGPIDPDILHRRASLRGLNYRPTLSLLGGPPSRHSMQSGRRARLDDCHRRGPSATRRPSSFAARYLDTDPGLETSHPHIQRHLTAGARLLCELHQLVEPGPETPVVGVAPQPQTVRVSAGADRVAHQPELMAGRTHTEHPERRHTIALTAAAPPRYGRTNQPPGPEGRCRPQPTSRGAA